MMAKERRQYNERLIPVDYHGQPALRHELVRSGWPLIVAKRLLGFHHPALADVFAVHDSSYTTENFGEPMAVVKKFWTLPEALLVAKSWADVLVQLQTRGVVPYIACPNAVFDGADGHPKIGNLLRFVVIDGDQPEPVYTREYPSDYAETGVQAFMFLLMPPSFVVTGRYPERDLWTWQARCIHTIGCGLSYLLLRDWARGRPDPFNRILLESLPEGMVRTFVDRCLATDSTNKPIFAERGYRDLAEFEDAAQALR